MNDNDIAVGKDKREPGFYIVDNEVLDFYCLTDNELWCYSKLSRHAFDKEAFISIRDSARRSKRGKERIHKSLNTLVRRGLTEYVLKKDGTPALTDSGCLIFNLLTITKKRDWYKLLKMAEVTTPEGYWKKLEEGPDTTCAQSEIQPTLFKPNLAETGAHLGPPLDSDRSGLTEQRSLSGPGGGLVQATNKTKDLSLNSKTYKKTWHKRPDISEKKQQIKIGVEKVFSKDVINSVFT